MKSRSLLEIAVRQGSSPAEGSRAAHSRTAALAVDTSWKCFAFRKGFREEVIACTDADARERLVEEAIQALYPAVDAAVACGEVVLSVTVPDVFGEQRTPSTEAFLERLTIRLERDRYKLFRFEENRSLSALGDMSSFGEVVYVTW